MSASSVDWNSSGTSSQGGLARRRALAEAHAPGLVPDPLAEAGVGVLGADPLQGVEVQQVDPALGNDAQDVGLHRWQGEEELAEGVVLHANMMAGCRGPVCRR